MENFYYFLSTNASFKKIEFEKITIIEYDCPLNKKVVPVWSAYDYVVHVLNGKKTWQSNREVMCRLPKEIIGCRPFAKLTA